MIERATIESKVKYLLDAIRDRKTRQRVDASDATVSKTTISAGWDYSTVVPANSTRRVRVTFTPTHPGKPYAEIDTDVTYTGAFGDYAVMTDPAAVAYTDKVSWVIVFMNPEGASHTFQTRNTVRSVDTGLISYTAL